MWIFLFYRDDAGRATGRLGDASWPGLPIQPRLLPTGGQVEHRATLRNPNRHYGAAYQEQTDEHGKDGHQDHSQANLSNGISNERGRQESGDLMQYRKSVFSYAPARRLRPRFAISEQNVARNNKAQPTKSQR
jgi:hypothetical protein